MGRYCTHNNIIMSCKFCVTVLSLLFAWPPLQSSLSKRIDLVASANHHHASHQQKHSASSLGQFPIHRNGRMWGGDHQFDGIQTPLVSSSSPGVLLDLRCGSADDDNNHSHDLEFGDEAIANVGVAADDAASQQAMVVDLNVVENDSLLSCTATFDNDAITVSNYDDNEKAPAGIIISEHDEDSGGTDSRNTKKNDELDDNNSQDVIVDTVEGSSTKYVSGRSNDNAGRITTAAPATPCTTPSSFDDACDTASNGIKMNLSSQLSLLRLAASDRRAVGRTLHDSGNLNDAAVAFREAALLYDETILLATELSVGGYYEDDASSPLSKITNTNNEHSNMAVERATCRLHEALCLLKDGRPDECIAACTDVLQDEVTVFIPTILNGRKENKDNNEDKQNVVETSTVPFSRAMDILKASYAKRSPQEKDLIIPPQIRARAHHRRAKARLALRDFDGAYEDARSAAFLGDRNAVQFYGRLMREGGSVAALGACGDSASSPGGLSFFELLERSSSKRGERSNLPEVTVVSKGMSVKASENHHPFKSFPGSRSDYSSSLLNLLYSGGTRCSSKSSSSGGNPFFRGLIVNRLTHPPSESGGGRGRRRRGNKSSEGSSSKDGLAKSFLFSLMNGIEDEGTQRTICNYLHSTNTQQVMQYASVAGMPMKEETARRLVAIANGVTPYGIRKSISYLKVGCSIFKTVRKILQVIDNCKSLVILTVLFFWLRSAMVESCLAPNKQARKLVHKTALCLMCVSWHSFSEAW